MSLSGSPPMLRSLRMARYWSSWGVALATGANASRAATAKMKARMVVTIGPAASTQHRIATITTAPEGNRCDVHHILPVK